MLRCGAGRAGFLALLGLNSFLAFFVNLSNFLVTKHTSALTLQARIAPCMPGDGAHRNDLGPPSR